MLFWTKQIMVVFGQIVVGPPGNEIFEVEDFSIFDTYLFVIVTYLYW